MRTSTLLAPAAALLLSGCLASKGDIRLLQDDLSSTRAQQAQQAEAQERARARDDSLARVRLDAVVRTLADLNDSLRAFSARFMDYQANSRESVRQLAMQVTQLENRVGISQQQIQQLLAQGESQPAPVAPPASTSSSRRDTAAADTMPVVPPPAQLFQLGKNQYNNGAYSTARQTFTLELSTYPTYSDIAAAAVYVGICYDAEGNTAAADSVYQSVYTQYPKSPSAAMALFKYGDSQQKQGKFDAARAAWQRILKDYPTSDEAALVPDRLKALPGK